MKTAITTATVLEAFIEATIAAVMIASMISISGIFDAPGETVAPARMEKESPSPETEDSGEGRVSTQQTSVYIETSCRCGGRWGRGSGRREILT